MLWTEIVSDNQNNFCAQHVLPMFRKNKSFWQRFTCAETMLTKAQEMTEDNVTDLEVCDFFIARFVMDKEEEKYHDHFAFVKEK